MLKFSDFTACLLPLDQHFSRLLSNRRSPSSSFTPMSPPIEQSFLGLWQLLLETERQTENIRQKLHRNQQFNTERAFMLLNIQKDGFLSANQLK